MKKETFRIGDEITCKIDRTKGYIVEYFDAVMVNFEGKLKVIPKRCIVENGEGGAFFRNLSNDSGKGQIVDKKRFYVVHLANGQLKIATSEILLKGHKKVIPVLSGKCLGDLV